MEWTEFLKSIAAFETKELAIDIAAEGDTLLKNADNALPLASYGYRYISFNLLTNKKFQGLYVYKDITSYVSRLNHLMKSI